MSCYRANSSEAWFFLGRREKPRQMPLTKTKRKWVSPHKKRKEKDRAWGGRPGDRGNCEVCAHMGCIYGGPLHVCMPTWRRRGHVSPDRRQSTPPPPPSSPSPPSFLTVRPILVRHARAVRACFPANGRRINRDTVNVPVHARTMKCYSVVVHTAYIQHSACTSFRGTYSIYMHRTAGTIGTMHAWRMKHALPLRTCGKKTTVPGRIASSWPPARPLPAGGAFKHGHHSAGIGIDRWTRADEQEIPSIRSLHVSYHCLIMD